MPKSLDDVKFCDCRDPRGTVHVLGQFEKFLLRNGDHTAFIFMMCGKCGGYKGQPDYNFKLALDQGSTDGLLEIIRIVARSEALKQR